MREEGNSCRSSEIFCRLFCLLLLFMQPLVFYSEYQSRLHFLRFLWFLRFLRFLRFFCSSVTASLVQRRPSLSDTSV